MSTEMVLTYRTGYDHGGQVVYVSDTVTLSGRWQPRHHGARRPDERSDVDKGQEVDVEISGKET